MQDIRFALRSFRHQPVFTIVVLLTLGVGIGGNIAIFSLFYQLLLRPLPYPDEQRLVFIWNSYPKMGLTQASVSIPDFLDRAAQAPSIDEATLFTTRSLNLASDRRPEQLTALAITPSFFSTLQRQPSRGRAFRPSDAEAGADRFVILTSAFWRSHFDGDESIIGRDIRLSGEPYRVVGVLPADVELPARDIALLVPFSFTAAQRSDGERGNEFSQMIARLKPDATISGLHREMATIVSRNLERLPERRAFVESSGFGGYAVPIRDQLVGDVREALYLLQAGVLLVLLIACVNVANLLLMRVSGRQRELAIRSALGAATGRLTRQLLIESLILSSGGAALGLALGSAGVRVLLALTARDLPVTVDGSLHPAVILFAIVLALVTGLGFGLTPAVSLIRGNVASLKENSAKSGTAGRRSTRAHATLVVVETAVALALLAGAGLLIKSFAGLRAINPGFSSANVLTASLALPESEVLDGVGAPDVLERLLETTRALPGVATAGLSSNIPFSGRVSSGSYSIIGYTPGPGEAAPHGRQEVVGGDYFRAMQIPLLAGRTFDDRDGPDSPPVAVIDEYLVKRYFTDGKPVGRQVRRGGPGSAAITIIGVVGTVNAIDLGQPVSKERLYYPFTQVPSPTMALMLKTAIEPQTLVSLVRSAVQRLDPEQPVADVRTMNEWMARSLETRRAPMMLFAAFGIVALVLAAMGTYGVLAFGVSQRVRELGIRQALGANERAILALVLAQGLRRAAAGAALGCLGALALGQWLQSQLVGVTSRDLGVLSAATMLLLAVSAAACYVPARRAVRLDPAAALRDA